MSALLKTSIIAYMVVFWIASDENVILEIFAVPFLRIAAPPGAVGKIRYIYIYIYIYIYEDNVIR